MGIRGTHLETYNQDRTGQRRWFACALIFCGSAASVLLAACTSNEPLQRGTTKNFAILAPATVAPRIAECHESVGYGNDGAAGPLFCGSGRINATAWAVYAKLAGPQAPVLKLGRDATLAQIKKALCTPGPGGNTIIADEYTLAKAYYGWTAHFDALEWVSQGNCVPPRDRG